MKEAVSCLGSIVVFQVELFLEVHFVVLEGLVERSEHAPHENSVSGKDDQVDGNGLHGVSDNIYHAYDEGAKALEEKKQTKTLEELCRNSEANTLGSNNVHICGS